ncbi:MAG: M28 family peptidase [Candidatus Omnitrophica bacterium]|nr:M28 family peptidase [Candidatus Omnitrophota bacterium]
MIESLKRHVEILSKEIGERNFLEYQNLERAANYIREEFKSYGYETGEQVYSFENRPYRNIIATKKGRFKPDKIIIVCSHYDSVIGSPGADDNASGVSGLLELGRLLSSEEINKTVKFIAFVNEEPPFFMTRDMGSFRYAQEAKQRGEDIEGVLCLESIGFYSSKKGTQSYPFGFRPFYPDKANFIGMVSNFNSRHLLKKAVKYFKEKSDFPLEYLIGFSFLAPAISFSDHWSFWNFGYRAAMITDTAFYRNPHYHTLTDTPEKLDYASMSEVISGLYGTIKGLLND